MFFIHFGLRVLNILSIIKSCHSTFTACISLQGLPKSKSCYNSFDVYPNIIESNMYLSSNVSIYKVILGIIKSHEKYLIDIMHI